MTDISFDHLAARISYLNDRTIYPNIPILMVTTTPSRHNHITMPDSLQLADMLHRALQRESSDRPDFANITRLNEHRAPPFFTRLTEAINSASAAASFNRPAEARPRDAWTAGDLARIIGQLDYAQYDLPAAIRTGDMGTLDAIDTDSGYGTTMWGVTLTTGSRAGENWLIPESNLEVIA